MAKEKYLLDEAKKLNEELLVRVYPSSPASTPLAPHICTSKLTGADSPADLLTAIRECLVCSL